MRPFVNHLRLKKYLLLYLFLVVSSVLLAKKKTMPLVDEFPFQGGELIEYNAYYNWGFIWLDAARVDFQVSDTVVNNADAFSFYSTGVSLDDYDWVFKVRDYYSSIAAKSDLSSLTFSRDTYEGGYKVDNKYRFDQNAGLVYMETENSDQPLKLDTVEIQNSTFDLLTAVYYARRIDYSRLKVDEKIPITVISDGEVFDLYFRYKGKERVKTRGTNEEYDCAKFTVLLIEGTIFNEGEDMTIWVSDDKARIPIMVEAKILIGSVKAILSTVKGNKYPIESKLANN